MGLLSWTCTKAYATNADLVADLGEFEADLDIACDQFVAFPTNLTELTAEYGSPATTRSVRSTGSRDIDDQGSRALSPYAFECQTSVGLIAERFEDICTVAGAAYRVVESTPPTYVCEDPSIAG